MREDDMQPNVRIHQDLQLLEVPAQDQGRLAVVAIDDCVLTAYLPHMLSRKWNEEHWLREAVETLSAHPEVASIYLMDFGNEKALTFLSSKFQSEGKLGRGEVLWLVDLRIGRSGASAGARLLEENIRNALQVPACLCRIFSAYGDEDLQKRTGVQLILKKTSAEVNSAFEEMQQLLRQWVQSAICPDFILRPFMTQLKKDLFENSAFPPKAHFPSYWCENTNTFRKTLNGAMRYSETRDDYLSKLRQIGVVEERVITHLFHPLESPEQHRPFVPPYLAKALSHCSRDNQTEFPGYWIGLIFNSTDQQLLKGAVPIRGGQLLTQTILDFCALLTQCQGSVPKVVVNTKLCISLMLPADARGSEGLKRLKTQFLDLAARKVTTRSSTLGPLLRLHEAGVLVELQDVTDDSLPLIMTTGLVDLDM
ncbi:MAG: hypothetical protein C4586_07645 [Anaerolineaceae bacterium]|nr:MAG: hypothetical protein C4586_07645 [Anaerolineaceae bacterium]